MSWFDVRLPDPPLPSIRCRCALILIGCLSIFRGVTGHAAQVTITAMKDNTIFNAVSTDAAARLNSNGSGDFISFGWGPDVGSVRRGLVFFDLSTVPAGAQLTVGSLELSLRVVQIPQRDTEPRPLWLVPAPTSWGEGASAVFAGTMGSGRGAPAMAGDATWFHSQLDPDLHVGHPFEANGPGYWSAPGALGDVPLDAPMLYGSPAAIVPLSMDSLTIRSTSLETDLAAWLAGQPNHGWMLLGDETLTSEQQTSVRGVASHEHATAQFRPMLTFEYTLPGGAGDFNRDGVLDVIDLDALSVEILAGTNRSEFDLTSDTLIDATDHQVWVHELRRTWFGDANLDSQFDTADLIHVFQIGQYEDGIPRNSNWSAGDWNVDGDFDSGDIITAFQDGGYEQDPRLAVAVPEPAHWFVGLVTLSLFGMSSCEGVRGDKVKC